jgi:hypothetical protein
MADGLDLSDDLDAAWRRSRKGNLWRKLEGVTLTVFRCEGGWRYCVADAAGPRYGERVYDGEEEAALAAEAFVLEEY